MMNATQLTEEEFTLISGLVYEKFGIKLGEQKRALIIGRLQKVLRSGGFSSFKEYYNHVVQEPTGQALLNLVDEISTNHTLFFRENEHFDFFSTAILPQISRILQRNNMRNMRIWCAGCSSGEEPYTLSMVLSEYFGANFSNINASILATDISVSALEKAVAGIYPADRMSQIAPAFRRKYFTSLKDGSWAVKKVLKDMVLFRRLNLISRDYPFKGLFHTIFCRNVMIYFDKPTQQALIERFHRYTEPGGYLFIGHSESLDRSSAPYRYIRPSVYQREEL